jgi:hypothetical protein
VTVIADKVSTAKISRAEEEAGRREAILKRLRWAKPGGLTQSMLEARLGWPTGVPTVLRELVDRGEAHQIGNIYHEGPGPAKVETPAAPSISTDEVRGKVLALVDEFSWRYRMNVATSITGSSMAVALRVIDELVRDNVLQSEGPGGRIRRMPVGKPLPVQPVDARRKAASNPEPSSTGPENLSICRSSSGEVSGSGRAELLSASEDLDPHSSVEIEVVTSGRVETPAAPSSTPEPFGELASVEAASSVGDHTSSSPDSGATAERALSASGQDGAAAPAAEPRPDPVPDEQAGEEPATLPRATTGGQRLQDARDARGWTQSEMARQLSPFLPGRSVDAIRTQLGSTERGARCPEWLGTALDAFLSAAPTADTTPGSSGEPAPEALQQEEAAAVDVGDSADLGDAHEVTHGLTESADVGVGVEATHNANVGHGPADPAPASVELPRGADSTEVEAPFCGPSAARQNELPPHHDSGLRGPLVLQWTSDGGGIDGPIVDPIPEPIAGRQSRIPPSPYRPDLWRRQVAESQQADPRQLAADLHRAEVEPVPTPGDAPSTRQQIVKLATHVEEVTGLVSNGLDRVRSRLDRLEEAAAVVPDPTVAELQARIDLLERDKAALLEAVEVHRREAVEADTARSVLAGELADVDDVLRQLGVPEHRHRAFRLGWLVCRNGGAS